MTSVQDHNVYPTKGQFVVVKKRAEQLVIVAEVEIDEEQT